MENFESMELFAKEHGEEIKKVLRLSQIHAYESLLPNIDYTGHWISIDRCYMKDIFSWENPVGHATSETDWRFMVREGRSMWSYLDHWHGDRVRNGMTAIGYLGRAAWTMVYSGRILAVPGHEHWQSRIAECVTECLREAMMQSHPKHPWRGPSEFAASNGLIYQNEWTGDIQQFSGKEKILSRTWDAVVYEMTYMGGIVDQY